MPVELVALICRSCRKSLRRGTLLLAENSERYSGPSSHNQSQRLESCSLYLLWLLTFDLKRPSNEVRGTIEKKVMELRNCREKERPKPHHRYWKPHFGEQSRSTRDKSLGSLRP